MAEKSRTTGGQEDRALVPAWPEGEWKFGGSLGFPGVGMQPVPEVFTLGAHAQYFPSGMVGVEGSLGFAPLGLAFGGLVVGGRPGVTVPLRAASILILPSAGVSALAGVSRNGLQLGPDLFYAGLATLHVGGVRLGVTVHWRDLSNEPAWLVEFGGIRLPEAAPDCPPRPSESW